MGTGEEWLGSPLVRNICIRIMYFWDWWRGKLCNINTFFMNESASLLSCGDYNLVFVSRDQPVVSVLSV